MLLNKRLPFIKCVGKFIFEIGMGFCYYVDIKEVKEYDNAETGIKK